MTEPTWDEGGLTEEETGRLLGSRGPSLTWAVPYRIELERLGDAEVFRPVLPMVGPGALPGWPDASEAPSMLEDFVRLADAPAETILAYARRFGLLGIGVAGVPPTFVRRAFLEPEPVAAWRTLARQTRALLNVAARLRQDESGRVEDWQALLPGRSIVLVGDPSQTQWDAAIKAAPAGVHVFSRINEQQVLSWNLEQLIVLSEVHPRPLWDPSAGRLQLGLGGQGLLGALVLQTVIAIAGLDGLGLCSACGEAYVPTRRPVTGTRHYCARCRSNGAPQRDASAALRGRKRLASRPQSM
jgi:hypothetical protein